jgi:putative protease
LLQGGVRQLVLNQPWQRHLLSSTRGVQLWAGPFCNVANPLAVQTLKELGFNGVIVSPELSREDYLRLPQSSPLPLGIVLSGFWPLCVSRILPDQLKTDQPFISPKAEQGWTHMYRNLAWVFPNWQLDMTPHRETLRKAGYQLFVHLHESLPPRVKLKKRPGQWNWRIGLQ